MRSTDPPPELVQRLGDVGPSVRPASQCRHGEGFTIRDSANRPALEFTLTSIDCSNDTRCRVSAGYHEAAESAASYTLNVVAAPQGHGWAVDSMHLDEIS